MTLKWIAAVVAVGLLAAPAGAESAKPAGPPPEAPALTTQQEKVSYAYGMRIAKQFQQQGIEIDVEALVKGLKDTFSGAKPIFTDEELQTAMTNFQNEMKQKQAEAAKLASEKNKQAGEAFLAQNKTKEGVITLPSGLQYQILQAGDGKKPTTTDTVECNYRGTLIDGTEFDSSYSRGKPTSFPVSGVIAGWTEALQLMPVGSKWQLFIPSGLAYGARGAGRQIGPNATLIFEIELLAIK